MLKFKDGKNAKEAADEVLRKYLLRRYTDISKQYPPITAMAPEDGVNHLFELKKQGKIIISLESVDDLIECTIVSAN